MKRYVFFVFFAFILPLATTAFAATDVVTTGGVDAAAFKSFSSCVASPAAAGKTIVVADAMNVNNLTVPAGQQLRFVGTGRLMVPVGKVVTIRAGIDASPTAQIFAGDGRVILDNGTDSYVKWFGARGDGSDEVAAINKAAAAVTSGRLIFTPGTYCVSLAILQKSNTEIVGTDRDNCIIRRVGEPSIDAGIISNRNMYSNPDSYSGTRYATAYLANNDTNLRVRNITLDGNKASVSYGFGISYIGVSDVLIENVRVINTRQQGIRITGSKGVSVRNVYSDGCLLDPIHLEDPVDYVIENNMVYNSGDYGIEVTAGMLPENADKSTGRGVIKGNHVENCVAFGIAVRGWKGASNPNDQPVSNVIIQGNTVTGCRQGISFNEWVRDVAVIGNIAYGNGSGIGTAPNLTSARRLIIKGNIVKNSTGSGMDLATLSDSIIEGNIVTENALHGISGSLDRTNIANNYIVDNCISKSKQCSGIEISYSSYAQILNNYIVNSNSVYAIAEAAQGYIENVMVTANYVDRALNIPSGRGNSVKNFAGMSDGRPSCLQMTQAVPQAASSADDVVTLKSDFNALLMKLKDAGLMAR